MKSWKVLDISNVTMRRATLGMGMTQHAFEQLISEHFYVTQS